jgi:type III secretion protein S
MDQYFILDQTLRALLLVLMLSMPPIIVATLLGLGVSLLQALTQIQEQTLSFAVKLIGVIVTLIVTATWLSAELFVFAQNIFQNFHLFMQFH